MKLVEISDGNVFCKKFKEFDSIKIKVVKFNGQCLKKEKTM